MLNRYNKRDTALVDISLPLSVSLENLPAGHRIYLSQRARINAENFTTCTHDVILHLYTQSCMPAAVGYYKGDPGE